MNYAVVAGAGLFVLLGGYLCWIGAQNVWRGVASEAWPRVTAVASTSPQSDVEFHYDVGGVPFVTDLRHFGQAGASDSSELQLLAYRYPPGRILTVAHHPHDPWIAAAEPGFHSDSLFVLGAGLAFAVPGIMCILMWFGITRGNERGFALGLGIFCSIFMTIGLVFLSAGLLSMYRSYASTHWPKTKGLVVCGRGVKPEAPDPDFNELQGTHFVYRFDVDGHRYYSNVRKFGQVDDGSMQHDELYPLGGPVTVSYSPGNPAISTVETGISSENYWIPGAGAAFFLFGLAAIVFGIPALTR
jgi:hypothetical protein